ncbi:MAG: hypothetical protein JSV92_05315, partial [archaeon]
LRKKFDVEYQDQCDLCYLAMKYKNGIESLPEPGKLEKLLFFIRNFHYIFINYAEKIVFRLNHKVADFVERL